MVERRLIDINELSEYLGMAAGTLYNWVSQGRIPYKKLGHLTKFDLREIDEWVDSLPGNDVHSALKACAL